MLRESNFETLALIRNESFPEEYFLSKFSALRVGTTCAHALDETHQQDIQVQCERA